MTLVEIFERELAKLEPDAGEKNPHHALMSIGRLLAEKYREQQETLANIAALYVKAIRPNTDQ